MFLKQSTASQTVLIGPFIDDSDFVSEETGLTIANTDIRLSKAGGNTAAKNSGGGTHDELGWYQITLDATDTNTVGLLQVYVSVAGALPVWHQFYVLEENVYDAIFASSADLGTDVASILTDTGTTLQAELDAIQAAVITNAAGADVAADIIAIKAETAAIVADTNELQTDDYPTRFDTLDSSIAGIGSGSGGSIPFQAIEDNTGGAIDPSSAAFVGSVTGSTTFANTASADGTSHTMDDTGNDIDIVYGYQVGGGRLGVQVKISANVDGNADEMKVKAYDHVGDDWEVIGTLSGSGGTSLQVLEPVLFQKHTGTGSELGKVYIRFETDSTTPSALTVDQCVVLAANLSQSVGYAGGSIWIDTNNGVAGTESFVNGVADNPVDSIADAITIAGNVGLNRFTIAAGSSITLAASAQDYELMGDNWTLAFGGQSIANAKIVGATVSGTYTGTTAILEYCIINAITGPGITMRTCFFNEITMTANGAGNWFLNDCRSRVAGSAHPTFDYGAGVGNTGLNLRAYSGGIELENMGDTGTDTASIEGTGNIILNANCDGGAMSIRGLFTLTDSSGNVTVTDDARYDVAQVNTEVDTALSDYDPPTRAELTSDISGLNDLSAAQVNAEVDTALTDYDAPTKAELDSGLAALNDLSAAQVNAEVDTALSDYDPPTRAELSSDIAGLNDVSTADINAQVLDVLNVDTFSELTGVPADDATLTEMVRWLYILARNKLTQTSSTLTVLADDGSTSVATSSVSDDGSVATRNEFS